MRDTRHLKLNSSEEYQASVTFLLTLDAGCTKLPSSQSEAVQTDAREEAGLGKRRGLPLSRRSR
jgi:hypothetical protein